MAAGPVNPPVNPSGYSGTPLHRTLGVKPGAAVLAGGPPDGFDVERLVAPPGELPAGMAATAIGGRCWVAWPKTSSGVRSDLTGDVVRAAALAAGWVDVKVCAIDAVWSGLCLMRRRGKR